MADPGARGRRAVLAWSFYDFANSAFTTLVVTFVYAAYFTHAIAPDDVTGTALWSRGVALTGVVVALLSPVLGAVADTCGCRKLLLALTTVLCAGGTVGLFFAQPGQVDQALCWFVVANIAFELGTVFYNAYLPEIATPDRIGRISGYGWSLGYVGGLLCMWVAMVGFVSAETPWFGFDRGGGQNIRAVNLLVAAWFALFSLPMFLWVRDPVAAGRLRWRDAAASLRQLGATLAHIRRYRQIVRLLVARLLYNDGLITVFSFGGIYATGTFGFSFQDLMVFGLAINAAAGVGAFALGFLDDWLGGKRTIGLSVAGLILASLAAVLTDSVTVFWGAALGLGLLSGPAQAASRSLMGRFVPPRMESEFYGLYAFSGKATAFVGPFLLGVLTQVFDSQRAGISIVILLLALGGLVLLTVNEEEGQRAAAAAG